MEKNMETAIGSGKLKVGILIEPGVLMMDVVGAQAVFGMSPGIELYHVGKTEEPIHAGRGRDWCSTAPSSAWLRWQDGRSLQPYESLLPPTDRQ